MNDKKVLLVTLLICILQSANAQNWRFPDCRDLEITKVVWSENSTDTLLVKVFNHCDTCETHVYTGLIGYQGGDTLAINEVLGSKPTPSNNDDLEYVLFKVRDFEISDDIRFEMVWGICDTIPYAANVILDVETTKDDIEIELYPNPTQDILHFKIPVDLTIHSIKLLDMQGRKLLEFDKNARQLDTKNYGNGVYIITMDTDKGVFARKVNIVK